MHCCRLETQVFVLLLAALPALVPAQPSRPFVFGAASAAWQYEGALNAGGRGPSIWEAFCGGDRPSGVARCAGGGYMRRTPYMIIVEEHCLYTRIVPWRTLDGNVMRGVAGTILLHWILLHRPPQTIRVTTCQHF